MKKSRFKLFCLMLAMVILIMAMSASAVGNGYEIAEHFECCDISETVSTIRKVADMSEAEQKELRTLADIAISNGAYQSFTVEEYIKLNESRVADSYERLALSESLLASAIQSMEERGISLSGTNDWLKMNGLDSDELIKITAQIEEKENQIIENVIYRLAIVEREREALEARKIFLTNLPIIMEEVSRSTAKTDFVVPFCEHNNRGPEYYFTETLPYSDASRCGTVTVTYLEFFCRSCNNWISIEISRTMQTAPHDFRLVGNVRLCGRCGRVG